jgi:hypothetical protein
LLAILLAVVASAGSPDRRSQAPAIAAPTAAPTPTASTPLPSRPVKAVAPAPKKTTKAKPGRDKDHQPASGRPKDREKRHSKGHR